MSWFINGKKEWSTGITTTFNTSQSTTTTFSTSKSTTTTFSTSRSTTTTNSTSKTTTKSTSGTESPAHTENPSNYRWIIYGGNGISGAANDSHLMWGGSNVGQGSVNANVLNLGVYTYYKGNYMTDPANHGSCCGGINYNYYNIAYRTGAFNTSYTTTFNTSKSTTTTFNTSKSTTTTFNTSRSTTTTFSTSRATERTTNFYA